MDKVILLRKDVICCHCGQVIKKGDGCWYDKGKTARYQCYQEGVDLNDYPICKKMTIALAEERIKVL